MKVSVIRYIYIYIYIPYTNRTLYHWATENENEDENVKKNYLSEKAMVKHSEQSHSLILIQINSNCNTYCAVQYTCIVVSCSKFVLRRSLCIIIKLKLQSYCMLFSWFTAIKYMAIKNKNKNILSVKLTKKKNIGSEENFIGS